MILLSPSLPGASPRLTQQLCLMDRKIITLLPSGNYPAISRQPDGFYLAAKQKLSANIVLSLRNYVWRFRSMMIEFISCQLTMSYKVGWSCFNCLNSRVNVYLQLWNCHLSLSFSCLIWNRMTICSGHMFEVSNYPTSLFRTFLVFIS